MNTRKLNVLTEVMQRLAHVYTNGATVYQITVKGLEKMTIRELDSLNIMLHSIGADRAK